MNNLWRNEVDNELSTQGELVTIWTQNELANTFSSQQILTIDDLENCWFILEKIVANKSIWKLVKWEKQDLPYLVYSINWKKITFKMLDDNKVKLMSIVQ